MNRLKGKKNNNFLSSGGCKIGFKRGLKRHIFTVNHKTFSILIEYVGMYYGENKILKSSLQADNKFHYNTSF